MALTREEQNERNRQAAAISGLLRNPGWAEMERALERKIANQREIVLAYALSPDGADQRKIDQAPRHHRCAELHPRATQGRRRHAGAVA